MVVVFYFSTKFLTKNSISISPTCFFNFISLIFSKRNYDSYHCSSNSMHLLTQFYSPTWYLSTNSVYLFLEDIITITSPKLMISAFWQTQKTVLLQLLIQMSREQVFRPFFKRKLSIYSEDSLKSEIQVDCVILNVLKLNNRQDVTSAGSVRCILTSDGS